MKRGISTAVAAIAAGTSIFAIVKWLRSKPGDERNRREELIDEVSLESFPASDPPPWTLGDDGSGR